MLKSLIAALPFLLGASVASAANPTVVCVAGQCVQGYTNTTIGVVLSAPGSSTSVQLLPGQYTSSTSPQLLHSLLTSPSASLSTSPGFTNDSSSSVSLPLSVALQPGIATYPQANYSGSSAFIQLPSSNGSLSSSQLTVGSMALSSNVWVAVSSSGSSLSRLVLWDSIPDTSQLPSSSSLSTLSVLDIQSSSCSPPCSGSSICSSSGQCTCPPGFTGSSCESCASGFFGPTCTKCPDGCPTGSCDEGISGSGRCLVAIVQNKPETCNCLNGVCGTGGACTCNPGWTSGTNGTACSKCSDGFFLTSDGNCQVCQLGCEKCADGNGQCISCKQGFTQNANDRTKCLAPQSVTPTGTVCPDGSFSDGTNCTPCSPLCQTCTGATSNDCIICGAGKYTLNGSCVGTDGNGVCAGSTAIADNNKHECDSCPAKCTSCQIPNFNVASTIDQVQCTGCLPGFVLSKGKCIESCPSGTFLDPKDNVTCSACDSSCGTCAGSATFCLTCANNQLSSQGKCVASCPSNSFSSSASCIPCHPDCTTCSGASFNQCSSCSANRPVLTSGRCLSTCSKTQYFDKTSSTCQSCDSSCSSCSGPGPSNCLACSNSNQVLRSGACTSVTCGGSSSTGVIPGLGLCLSDLVFVPQASGTNSPLPLPTITGIDTPVGNTSQKRPLEWWQILLMALGCAFIFLVFLMCWRRRARKQRVKATAKFAFVKGLDKKHGWRWRLARFGERLFGHKKRPVGPTAYVVRPYHDDEEAGLDRGRSMKLEKMNTRGAEQARSGDLDMDQFLDSYDYSRAGSSRSPSPLPSLRDYNRDILSSNRSRDRLVPERLSAASNSLYSQVTGMPRRQAEPRQPVKNVRDLLPSRFSGTSYSTSSRSSPPPPPPPPPPPKDLLTFDDERPPTPAEEYKRLVTTQQYHHQVEPRGNYWLQSTNTGNSSNSNHSRNPFRKMSD